jgi:hypothetical protein
LLDIIPINFCALCNYYIILVNGWTNYTQYLNTYQQKDINRQGNWAWEYEIIIFHIYGNLNINYYFILVQLKATMKKLYLLSKK